MSNSELLRGVWRHPAYLLATGLGIGLVPFAPGTFGTLLAIPLYLLLNMLFVPWYLVAVLVLFIVGVWICGKTARYLQTNDHPSIVWDEIVGFLVALFLAPQGWIWVAVGFILFRLFDVWKPVPIRWIERQFQGGWGIMLDDLVAGIYALVLLQLLHFIV